MGVEKLVSVAGRVNPEHRQGFRLAAAKHELSMSSAVAAIVHAAADGDERVDAILADYAKHHQRQHGGARR